MAAGKKLRTESCPTHICRSRACNRFTDEPRSPDIRHAPKERQRTLIVRSPR
jgi:hypothetical protein